MILLLREKPQLIVNLKNLLSANCSLKKSLELRVNINK